MSRLSRYLFTECALATLAALVALTALVMLPQMLKLVDLWVNKNLPAAVLGQLVLLVIPRFLVASLPMALMLGILWSLGRMARDSEIVVMKAGGISLYRMARPVAALVLCAGVFSLWLNHSGAPHAQRGYNALRQSLAASTPLVLRPGTFNHTLPNLTMYLQGQSPDGYSLEGLFVHDARDSAQPVTLVARTGRLIHTRRGEWALHLEDGSRHQISASGAYHQLRFGSYDLNLGALLQSSGSASPVKPEAMTADELHQLAQQGTGASARAARMELQRRAALPVATMILGLAAIPLGVRQSPRAGRSLGFVAGVLLLIGHFLLLTSGEALARRELLEPAWGFWLPNALVAMLVVFLFRRVANDRAVASAPRAWLASLMARRHPAASPPRSPS
ncbi:MAG: LPS export ABC transporter permease LptF [Magnetococcus sp. WYHC-3]